MRLSRLLAFSALLFALVASACSSAPEPEQAKELLFPGDQSTPTVVPPGDPLDEVNEASTDTSDRPPTPLAFADWTVDDVVSQLVSALDEPVTVTFDGEGGEQLYISGEDWAVDSEFASVGQGDQQWVTYGHVEAGILSLQAYSAATTGGDISSLLDDPDTSDPVALQFIADRAVLTETSDFASMWVPYDPDASGFFSASVLTPRQVEDILDDLARGLNNAADNGTLTIAPNDSSVVASAPSLEYNNIEIADDGAIFLSSQGGWSLSIVSGVDTGVALGAPDTRDILTRQLLLTATSAPATCITPEVEASTIVESGLIVCTSLADLRALTVAATANNDTDSE